MSDRVLQNSRTHIAYDTYLRLIPATQKPVEKRNCGTNIKMINFANTCHIYSFFLHPHSSVSRRRWSITQKFREMTSLIYI